MNEKEQYVVIPDFIEKGDLFPDIWRFIIISQEDYKKSCEQGKDYYVERGLEYRVHTSHALKDSPFLIRSMHSSVVNDTVVKAKKSYKKPFLAINEDFVLQSYDYIESKLATIKSGMAPDNTPEDRQYQNNNKQFQEQILNYKSEIYESMITRFRQWLDVDDDIEPDDDLDP